MGNKEYIESGVALPVGRTEFDEWAAKVITLAGAPDNDSVRFALATMILHGDPEECSPPLSKYANKLKKSMANQVAAAVVQELKEKQIEQQKAAAAALSNESQG